MRRGLSYLMVWTNFFEQLSWAPILIVLAEAAGDVEVVALAASAYSAANMIGNAGFGMLADRLGRIKVAGAGFVAMAISCLLHAGAVTPALLVGVRFLHGITASAVAPAAFASLAAGAPNRRRGETMARAGLLIALASMLAPPVSGQLEAHLGAGGTVRVLAAGLAMVGLVALWQHRRASSLSPVEQDVSTRASHGAAPGADGRDESAAGLRIPLLAASFAIGFAVMFCQNTIFYALPLKTDALGLSAAQTGMLFSTFAAGALIAFSPPLSQLPDRRGRGVPLVIGLTLAAASLAALAPAATRLSMSLALFGYGLGFGLIFPALTALNADAAPPARQGFAFGLLTAAFSAGAITGPLVTHALRAQLVPFATCALLLAACTLFAGPRLWVVRTAAIEDRVAS